MKILEQRQVKRRGLRVQSTNKNDMTKNQHKSLGKQRSLLQKLPD